MIDAITFESQSDNAVCIDMLVAARLDGAELSVGSVNKFWMRSSCDGSLEPCYSEYTLALNKDCGYPGIEREDGIPVSSSISGDYYSLIIHVCGSEISNGASFDNVFVRFH